MTGCDLRIGNVCIDLVMTGYVWMHWLGLIIIGEDWFVLVESGQDFTIQITDAAFFYLLYMHIFHTGNVPIK